VDWSNRRPSNDTLVIVRHRGGAMARVAPEATAFGDRSSYFNFPGLLEEGDAAVRATYGDNHARLARIKAAYDPENRFRLNQNIRPEAQV
jgi:FAD/FMN-containing dehydrogenase